MTQPSFFRRFAILYSLLILLALGMPSSVMASPQEDDAQAAEQNAESAAPEAEDEAGEDSQAEALPETDDDDDESGEEASPAESDAEPESDGNAGQSDLDEAFDLKLRVTSTRDLDRIADLCESAIEKGLDAESQQQAEELWASTLINHARQLNRRIRPGGSYSTRWRWLRSQAIFRLRKAIELRPDKVDALIMLAQLQSLDAGDRDEALESIEKAIAQISDDKVKLSEALYVRAQLAEDDTARIADLTQAVKINPDNGEALFRRAMYFLDEEKTDSAMQDFQALLKIEEKGIDRHVIIAGELIRRDLSEQAIEILDDAVQREPENEPLLIQRARTHLAMEAPEPALVDLDKVLELNRLNVEARTLRARVHLIAEDYEDALADANEIIQQQPDDPEGLGLRSLIYRAQSKFDEAIADVETLLESDEDNLDFQFDLALMLNANDQPSRAIPYFDRVLQAVSERMATESIQVDILRSRGDAWLAKGKHERAINDYELALDLLSDMESSADYDADSERNQEVKSGLLNNLAWVLSTSPDDELRDSDLAIEFAEQAAELTEYKTAFILSTLASAYADSGDFEKARKWAAKAVELAASDEQRVGLQEELDSYNENKPWREREDVEAEKQDQLPGDDDGSEGEEVKGEEEENQQEDANAEEEKRVEEADNGETPESVKPADEEDGSADEDESESDESDRAGS